MKTKTRNKRRRGGINVTRATRRATMGRRSGYCVDTRNDYWNPTLIQHLSIPSSMLSPMYGWILKMMSTCSIGWRSRTVYMRLCLIRKYRISWFCTRKVSLVNGLWVAILWSWKNHGLKNFEGHSVYFSPVSTVQLLLLPKWCVVLLQQAYRQLGGEAPEVWRSWVLHQ